MSKEQGSREAGEQGGRTETFVGISSAPSFQ
jgi:hypothetical protein